MTAALICCRPVWSRGFPSGPAWAHTRDCPRAPGQKVRDDDPRVDPGRRGWWTPTTYAGRAAEAMAWKIRHGRG